MLLIGVRRKAYRWGIAVSAIVVCVGGGVFGIVFKGHPDLRRLAARIRCRVLRPGRVGHQAEALMPPLREGASSECIRG